MAVKPSLGLLSSDSFRFHVQIFPTPYHAVMISLVRYNAMCPPGPDLVDRFKAETTLQPEQDT